MAYTERKNAGVAASAEHIEYGVGKVAKPWRRFPGRRAAGITGVTGILREDVTGRGGDAGKSRKLLVLLPFLLFLPLTGVNVAAVMIDADIQTVRGVFRNAGRTIRAYPENPLV